MGEGFDQAGWQRRWEQVLREQPEQVAARPPNADLVALVDNLRGDLPPGYALDAGCGHGAEAIWMAAAGWNVTALDFSSAALEHGRSTATALGDDVDWLWFPNDTSRVDADFLERVAQHCVASATVCAGRLIDREGPRNPLPAPGTPLTKRSAWGAIEPATLFRRDAYAAVGGFDPHRGSGADTPWQSAEGPDLLLRMAARDGFTIVWADDIVVHAQTEFAHLPPDERRRKLRNYGRGAGNVLRTWHYPLWYKTAHLVAAALMPLRNPAKFGPRDGLALLIGRAEGLVGRPFTREADTRAILR
jgi:SAM-dependent methyltransferase